jgi:hypothetical protein
MTDKYIYLNSSKKIANPLYSDEKSDVFSFHGGLENIDFEHQATNYQNIIKSLEPFNIKFNEIWYAKFTNSVNQIRTHFLVKSEDGRVFWHKYEAMAPGGCQNKIFIDGKQYFLSQWLKGFSNQDREEIINNNQ